MRPSVAPLRPCVAAFRRRVSSTALADEPHASSYATSGLVEENELLKQEVAALRGKLRHQELLADSEAAERAAAKVEVTKFSGARSLYTTDLKFYYPQVEEPPAKFPCFRLMDDLGSVVEGAEALVPELPHELAVAMMTVMIRVNEFDKIFLDAQRQGRISFYMTSRGEEATAVGSAAALLPTDWVLPQYRELGVFFWRGLSFDDVANQLSSNGLDPAHGRQLPLHVGSLDGHLMYVKSTLGTQVPHATGVAYASKLLKEDRVAITYFGEGCASEGDIPSGLNIAAVHGCPTIFFCRNNGYAISTHAEEQYVGDGVAPRGLAFGMPTIRVDGNDILAVAAATHEARRIGLEENRPTMIEAMTYRIGAHSTSDDDTKYRTPKAPVEGWDSERAFWEARSPVVRFGRYLHSLGWFNGQMEYTIRTEVRKQAINSLNVAHEASGPDLRHLYTDVYDELPWTLREQQAALRGHIESHREHYGYVSEEQLEGL